jgi:raffinose/stachyose/melibiose transport system permease protein
MESKVRKKSVIELIVRNIFRVFLILLFLFPVGILFWVSVKTPKDISNNLLGWPTQWNLSENYSKAVEKMDFVVGIRNSLIVTIISTVCLCVFSSMAAWVLVRRKSKISTFIFMLFSVSMLIPFQCVMIPLLKLWGKRGISGMDFFGYNFNFLSHTGLILAYIGFGSAMSILLYHGFIKGIPVELEEAAAIDGCSNVGIFFKIVFPLLGPITTTVAIINIMWIWNDYLLPKQMIGGTRSYWTLPLQTYSFFGSFTVDWGVAAAALLLIMAPVIIFYLVAQKKIVKGVVDGAVK